MSALASQNWIGHGDVQDPEVPIIKVGHLLSRITGGGSLPDVLAWLRERGYLPVEGREYSIVPMEISTGRWQATWYAIKPLEV
jgi:hypothetical protein